MDSILNNVNYSEVKLDLNSKLSHLTTNEEIKRSTYHYSSIHKINETEENENSCEVNSETMNSICSEFDLFENNAVTNKVIAHTFRSSMVRKESINEKLRNFAELNEPKF